MLEETKEIDRTGPKVGVKGFRRNQVYSVPIGSKITDFVKRGMASGIKNSIVAAREVDLGWHTYAFVRKLLMTKEVASDQADKLVIAAALEKIDLDHSLVEARRTTEDLLKKYWPGRSRLPKDPKASRMRVNLRKRSYQPPKKVVVDAKAKFDRVMLGIAINCDCDEVEVPADLTEAEIKAAVKTIVEGRASVGRFRRRLVDALKALKETQEIPS